MTDIRISTIQQYSIDRIRVYLVTETEISILKKLRFEIFKNDLTDITSSFKSIADSNQWEEWISSVTYFDVCANTNIDIDKARSHTSDYTFKLYDNTSLCSSYTFSGGYIEDIRVSIGSVECPTLTSIKIKFNPLDSNNPMYQSRLFYSDMELNIIDTSDDNGVNYGDSFESINDAVSSLTDDNVTELEINLKEGHILPKGTYSIVFTAKFKSKTEKILAYEAPLLFMSHETPKIGECFTCINSNKNIVLSIRFSQYIEKGLFNDAVLKITDSNGVDVTSKFYALKIGTLWTSTAGVTYVTRVDLPLYPEYTLEESVYYIEMAFPKESLVEPIYSSFDSVAYIHALDDVTLSNLDKFELHLDSGLTQTYLQNANVTITMDGVIIDDFVDTIQKSNDLSSNELFTTINLNIKDKTLMKRGEYQFTLWHLENSNRVSDYIGSIDAVSNITPEIESVTQTDVDIIHVTLVNELPIEVVEYTTFKLVDSYDISIDYTSHLSSIRNSNDWDPGAVTVKEFDIVVADDSPIKSGNYTFSLIFGSVELKKIPLVLNYMEKRLGRIQNIEQLDLSHIKISFTDFQSRDMMLQLKFNIYAPDGKNYTERFELIENVLKDGQYSFTEITLPMANEQSLPAGKYKFELLYLTSSSEATVVYSFDGNLAYMSDYTPAVRNSIVSLDDNGLTTISINFSPYVEKNLFDETEYIFEDSNNIDVSGKFQSRAVWTLQTTTNDEIEYVKSVTIKVVSSSITIEKGLYHIAYTWPSIDYLPDLLINDISLDYVLPKIKHLEMSSLTRMYMEFSSKLQYTYLENAIVQVIDPSGQDHTEYFDTLQESNNIYSGLSTDNLNLNIKKKGTDSYYTDELSYGVYTIIFWHKDENGNRVSDYIGTIDIYAVLTPTISRLTQIGLDSVLFELASPIPVHILEEYTIKCKGYDKRDYSNRFRTITQSNNWEHDVREVDSFYLKLMGDYSLPAASYSFFIQSNGVDVSQYDITTKYMEGVPCDLTNVEPVTLSTLRLSFADEQKKEIHETLLFEIYDIDGKPYTASFSTIEDVLENVSDTFYDLDLPLIDNNELPKGEYVVIISRENTLADNTELTRFNLEIPFMTTQSPMLASVCVMADKYDNDGLMITFSPALEYGLFKSSIFTITNLSGVDISKKFTAKDDGVVDVHYSDFGNQLVDSVYLPFDTDYILTKDTYVATFRWIDITYVKPMQLETNLDYILYPVEKITISALDTLTMTFKEALDVSYLKDAELNVLYEYKYTTEDKEEKIIELDCTNLFQTIQTTNNFEDEMIASMQEIVIKLNENISLPTGTYRFIISHDDADYGDITYVYAGNLYITKMLSSSGLKSIKTIKQTDIDTLTIVFDKYQDIELLENLTVAITGSNGTLYSGYFKNVKDSNTIEYIDSDTGETLTQYFMDIKTEEFIIDSVNFPKKTVRTMRLVLNNDMALGPMAYTFKLSLDTFTLFEKTSSINFMTTTPSKISNMCIENSQLTVSFLPYAEYTSLLTSKYNIFNIQNEDKSNCFGSIFNGTFTKVEQGPITYVSKIGLDIQPNVSLPGGQYRLAWEYASDTFLPAMEYSSALPVISQGVKSVNLESCNTLLVVFEEKQKVSYIKGLSLSVVNSAGENCTDLFKDMKDSNEHLSDENAETDTFYIQVAEEEDVITSEYTFSLYGSNVNDANDISNNAIFTFSLNIIYMTNEFPGISVADNLSTEAFEIQTLTAATVSSYYGRYVQLLTSTTKEVLTADNQSVYLDQDIKIYSDASINELTFKLDNEIDPCLLLAIDISIINDDGDSVNDYFKSVAESNVFESREVLSYLKISVETPQLSEYFEECTVTIQDSLEEDITQSFKSIENSNSFDDDLKFASFNLEPIDDEIIEKYECADFKYTIVDNTGAPITKFIVTPVFKTITTVNSFKLTLKNGYTILQDTYTANMTYVNEPGILNAKVITAFSYNGDFPLLSTNMGKISSISSYDLSRMVITFSEALNVNVFNSLKLSVTDADGNEYSSYFKSVTESNSFDGITTIDQLPNPNQVLYELDAGRSLDEGTYTVSFDIDITANDDDESDAADVYEIFSRTGKLSYMIKENTNSITNVSIIGSSKLKMEFENAIDAKLLRTLTVSCMNQNNESTFDSFKPLTDSNNFGMVIILFEQRYFLYSYDAISWERFDTKQNETFNDIAYIPSLKRYVIACNKGKVILIDEMSSSNITVIEIGTTNNINSIEYSGDTLIACCTNGKVLSSEDGETWLSHAWNSQSDNTLTDIVHTPNVGYFVVGYKGTAYYSDIDFGTPVFYASELSTQENLTSCVYHANYKDEEGETVEVKSGYYVTGTYGLILYSKDGKGSWERLNTGTSKTLYSIASFGGTLIAVGESGTILMSTDGETWLTVDSGVSYPLKSVDYCDSLFIITSQTGDWLTSKTGTKWTINSSTYDSKIKTVKYIDSQYESNRDIKYCYFELKRNTELGAVNFYSGEDVPASDTNPTKYWISDVTKKNHIGDIYIRHVAENNSSNVEYYQYTFDDSEFKWVLSATIPTVGLYTFYINTVDANDEVVPLYPQKSDIPITYLTTKTGTMTNVTYNDPSKVDDVDYMYPYLNVEFTSGNEIASHYASFKLKNNTVAPVTDYSKCFKSIEQGVRLYKGTNMSNIILFANPTEINKLQSDKYTMKWFWSPFSETEYDVDNDLVIKAPFNLISNIGVRYKDGKPTPDTLEITFSKNIPLEYFSNTEHPCTVYLNQIQLKSSDDSSYNYMSQFQGILDVTSISDPEICVTVDGVKYLTKIYLQLTTTGTLPAGSYLFKMYNDNVVFDTDETQLNYATYSFTLDNELTTSIPELASVSLVKYKNTVSTLDGHTPNKYEGAQDPKIDDDLTSNWIVLDAQAAHVGDIYTNTTTNISYGFAYENGLYYWKPIVDKPNLCVSFSTYPQLDYVLKSSFELISKSGSNYTDLFETDPGDWTYIQSTTNGTHYVSKIYIPLDETKSFPGGDCIFRLKWAEGTPFNTLECDALNLKSVIHDYGKINKFEVAGYDVLHVEFSSEQSATFLKSLEWDLERIISSTETDSVTNMFYSIRESNNNFENIVKTKDIYLQLLPNQIIPTGTYNLSLIGERDKSDLLSGIVEDPTVSFEKRATITYISSTPPDDMTVAFSVSKSGFTKPVLTISFGDNCPDYGSIANFTVSVTRQDNGKDYSDYFCGYGSNEIKYTRVSKDGFNLVKTIDIPLKNDCAIKAGTYDVVFKFAKNTQLPQIPSSGRRSFKISSAVMTPLGRIRTAKAKPLKNMVVSFVLNSSIKNITALKSSKIGTELGIKSWKDIYNKLTISFVDEDGKERNGAFKTKVKASGSNLTLTLQKNTKFDPGEYTVTGYYNSSIVFSSKVVDLGGLISNNVVSTSKDKICYILEETRAGKTKYKVYSSYKKIKVRVNRLKKLNKASANQYKLCKKCRKKKLLSTSRIKTQIENLLIPGGRVSKAIELLVKNYYSKLVSKEIGCTKCEIEDDHCLDIKTGKEVYTSYGCENYVKKNYPYKYKMRIATLSGSFPRTGSKVIHFKYIVKNGVQLDRGFKANKKGKQSSKFKAYSKKITKYIKKYKKRVSTCKKCKKRTIAKKSSSSFGWGSALMPDEIRTAKNGKYAKKIAKKFNKAFSSKKMGCSKAKFEFVKSGSNCKLSCTKITKADKTMEAGEWRGKFIK